MNISIIIPFRNAEKTIQRCVDSILRQNIDDLQIILVNDHSKDNSYKICESLKQNEQIILVNTNGTGVSAARNTGLQFANKEIIGFCDADDYFESNVLKEILKEFENQNIKMVIAGYYKTSIDEKVHCRSKPMHLNINKKITVNRAEKLILLDNRVMGSVWNKFYRRSLIKSIYFDDNLSYCEDMHFNCKVLHELSKNVNEKSIKIVPYCVYHYVANPKSVTNTLDMLFDENNELKYIVTMDKIEEIIYTSKHYIRYKKFVFALNYISLPIVDLDQKNKLLQVIKDNFLYFILCFFCFPRKNMKFALQSIKVLMKN